MVISEKKIHIRTEVFMRNFTTILLVSLTVFSCATIPLENSGSALSPDRPMESVEKASGEVEDLSILFSDSLNPGSRDIDSREWLMTQVNFWADRDILCVQRIYEDLKYRSWSDDEKRQYIAAVLPPLQERREEVMEELSYLIGQSLLLQDMPWFVRDFYDERSEFSYWYLIYTGRAMDSSWLSSSVLPAMLRLIPEDRITAVSYLWLKTPGSLEGMESEVYLAGYPWTRLIYLLQIGDYCMSEIERLGVADTSFAGGSLF